MQGQVFAVSVSCFRGSGKSRTDRLVLIPHFGAAGDAHAGHPIKQISLLALHDLNQYNERTGRTVQPGEFAENILVETNGKNLQELLPIGIRFRVGQAILQASQHGKPIGTHHPIVKKFGVALVAKYGVFAVVRKGGIVAEGDPLVIDPELNRPQIAIITLSDRRSSGQGEDVSGNLIAELTQTQLNARIVERLLLPDEPEKLKAELIRLSDTELVDLIITTGGTGLSPRDTTPEATLAVADKEAWGLVELVRVKGGELTPKAYLSRAAAAVRKRTLILNLSGSPKAVKEQLSFLIPILPHALEVLSGAILDCGSN